MAGHTWQFVCRRVDAASIRDGRAKKRVLKSTLGQGAVRAAYWERVNSLSRPGFVGSDLRALHRFWTDYGEAGSYPKPEVRFGEISCNPVSG